MYLMDVVSESAVEWYTHMSSWLSNFSLPSLACAMHITVTWDNFQELFDDLLLCVLVLAGVVALIVYLVRAWQTRQVDPQLFDEDFDVLIDTGADSDIVPTLTVYSPPPPPPFVTQHIVPLNVTAEPVGQSIVPPVPERTFTSNIHQRPQRRASSIETELSPVLRRQQ